MMADATGAGGEGTGRMRVVVVGATGNVGTALLRRLGSVDRVDVTGVVRRAPAAPAPAYEGVTWVHADVSQPDAAGTLRDVFTGADAVVHLAWAMQPNRDEPRMQQTNVRGLERTLDAAAAAGVPHVIVLSSVGAYSLGPKHRRVDESWPTGGVPTSQYSRQKAAGERLLDRFERRHGHTVVARVRPGLVFQPDAASEIATLFIGSRFPVGVLRLRPAVLPFPSQAIVQAVHADDLADALWRMIDRRAGGAFNIAAEPVLDPRRIADAIGARWQVPVRARVARLFVELLWRARLLAMDPGWVDIAVQVPVMSTDRARTVLGWEPHVDAAAALAEVVDAMAGRRREPASPALSGAEPPFPGSEPRTP